MPNSQRVSRLDKIKGLFSGWNLFGTITLCLGLMTGLGIPLWQTYWVEIPELKVEVSSISRVPGAGVGIKLSNIPNSDVLEEYADQVLFQRERDDPTARLQRGRERREDVVFTSEMLEQTLELAKTNLQYLPERLDRLKLGLNDIQAMKPENVSYDILNQLVINEITYDLIGENRLIIESNIEEIKNSTANLAAKRYISNLIETIKNAYQSEISVIDSELRNLDSPYPAKACSSNVLFRVIALG